MNSEPDDGDKSSEGQTLPQAQPNRDYPAGSTGSPPPLDLDLESTPPDLETVQDEQGHSVLVADVRTIVGGGNQSQYAHFVIEIGTDGQPVELGKGAMGVTYRAIDTTLQRPVALKVISWRLIGNEVLKSRFIREARAAASLRHPNVASVFYLGSTESTYFYAMELVIGETLEQFIANQGPLDPVLALDISAQVTSALVAAHQAGLVHRDIKPANLILTRDEKGGMLVKVIDFGLVKLTGEPGDDSAMSDPGTFVGTPRYASPEQFSGGKIDIRSDLYAVGVTLWHMLTKATPFNGTPTQVAAQHLQSPLPIRELRHLPHPIVSLLAHLLEKNPEDRPQTPEELLVMLNATRRAIGGQVGAMVPAPMRFRRRWPWFSRSKMIYLAGALIILVAGAVLFNRFFPAHPLLDRKSVAVLPFDNLGDDNQNAYLSDGITAEVIFQLSRIADLRVISRDSVLRYKAVPASNRKSMREIANELEVATLLESNIQRSADRLKVRSVLYDANSGKQLWSQAYDREMNDLFAIQSDVAENIAAALQVQLSPNQRDNIQRQPTSNPTAYDLYLRANKYYDLRHKDDNEKAIALYQQAIEQDSKFALAYVGLANAYIERADRYGFDDSLIDAAADLCRKAIGLDPAQARAYAGLARALHYRGLDEQAHEPTVIALKLAPNDVITNRRAAYDAEMSGRVDEQYALRRKCHELEPNSVEDPYWLARICAWAGDTETMEKWMDRAINEETDSQQRSLLKCERLIFRRDYRNAIAGLRDLPLDLVGFDHQVAEILASCSARLGDWDNAVKLAGSSHSTETWWRLAYPALSEQAAGRDTSMREKAERLVSAIQQTQAGIKIVNWDAFYLAEGKRLLGQKEDAYNLFRSVFSPVLRHLPLMDRDPMLDVFREDPQFQSLTAELRIEIEKTRARIQQLEKSH
jgi:serine/threonine protein kinase/Tfp pilus assembly protein PilF